MNIYCTVFDYNYLARALVLHGSLLEHNDSALFAFICMDVQSAELLSRLALDRSLVIHHDEFASEALRKTRDHRSKGEYCWTSKPVAMQYLMDRFVEAKWIIYVDTDTMCFADPDVALPGVEFHYLITPHRFHTSYAHFAKDAGLYNAGYVAARNSPKGRQAILWWRDRCIENCSVIPTEATYADQKYLNQLQALFPVGQFSNHNGLNAAPWNIANYHLTLIDGHVMLDDQPLLLYHFQSLQVFDDGTMSLYLGNERIPMELKKTVYEPYVKNLVRAYEVIRNVDPSYNGGLFRKSAIKGNWVSRAMTMLRRRKNQVDFPVRPR